MQMSPLDNCPCARRLGPSRCRSRRRRCAVVGSWVLSPLVPYVTVCTVQCGALQDQISAAQKAGRFLSSAGEESKALTLVIQFPLSALVASVASSFLFNFHGAWPPLYLVIRLPTPCAYAGIRHQVSFARLRQFLRCIQSTPPPWSFQSVLCSEEYSTIE